MDLFTALSHELGQVIGLDRDDASAEPVMEPGVRLLPEPLDGSLFRRQLIGYGG